MAKKKKQMMWVCCNCGSTNVQTKRWVNLNTNEIEGEVSDGESDDNWCEDCEGHHDVDMKEVEI